MYNFVHLFGLWEEEGFILGKKFRGSCLKSALSVSWGTVGLKTVFVEELIVFLIISELWEKKLEFSEFFPAELWKLHFSCPGIIFKRNNLPEKQSCSTFSESEQRKTLILSKNFDRIVKTAFCVSKRTAWRTNFKIELKFCRSS